MILAFMPTRALFLALAFVLPLCAAGAAGAADGPGALDADLTVDGMTFVSSAGSHNDAIVEAARAQVGRADRKAHLSDVHARVGKAAGARTGTEGGLELRCERASFDLDTGDLTAEGNVTGVTADGRRFETERVIYKRDSGRVSTQAPVVIRDAFGTIRGAGFEYWVRENRFRLIGGASVEQGR
jgi:LPS export ABC transporter protein LptC